jgi:hypothetical protein
VLLLLLLLLLLLGQWARGRGKMTGGMNGDVERSSLAESAN